MDTVAQQKLLLQQAFREHIRNLCYERVRVSYLLGIVLVPVFSILDLVLVPRGHFGFFLSLRLGTALLLLGLLVIVYPSVGKRYPVLMGLLGPLLVGGSIAVMIRYHGGYASPYYAGLNLVILAVTLVLPFGVKETALSCGTVYSLYILPILFKDEIVRPDILINNNFFLLGTISIALTSGYYSQRLRFREFRSRYQLALTNERLRSIDQEKTHFFSNVGNLINSSLDWQSVMLSVLKLIKENFGFERAVCLSLDKEGRSVQRVLMEPDDEPLSTRLSQVPLDFGDAESGSASGSPALLHRRGADPGEAAQRILAALGSNSVAVLPIQGRDGPGCLLLVDNPYSQREISDEKFQLLLNLVQPVTAALDKSRLFEAERKRKSQLLVIHEISQTVSSLLDFKGIFNEFTLLLRRHFGYQHVSVYSLDDRKRLVMNAVADENPDCQAPGEIVPEEDSFLYKTLLRARSSVCGGDSGAPLGKVSHPGARCQVCIPFRYSSRMLGVINIESEDDRVPDDGDLRVLETLGDYLAIWINNANLYSEVGRKAGALQTLNSIGKAISSELNIHKLFELIYHQVSRVVPSEGFLIALKEKGNSRIEVKFEVADGKRRSYLSSLSHDGLVGYVMQTRTPFLVKDNFEKIYGSITGRAPHRIAQSWLGVPLILGEEALGVVVLQNFRIRRSYDRDDLNFLSTIADQAAVAIANARLFREAQERATRLAVVNEITREASLNLDVEQLFQRTNDQLKRVVSFEKSSIAIYEPETDTFSLVNVYGENITGGFYRGMQIPGRETVMRVAYETKKPYYTRSLDKILSNTSPYLVTQGIQSAVSIPIISDDVCLGTLNLGSQKEDGFSEDQIDLLVTIANSLGTALKNARLYSQLEQSYSELQDTQDQLVKSEKLRALGEMSAGVAHDFNNILGAILGRAQLMKGQTEDPRVLRGLDIIEKAAIDGASTVKRLQDFTRKRTDQVFKHVDLVEVIEDTLSMTRTRWEDSAHISGIKYQITRKFESSLPVAGEASELREVFTNIIFNALDAMPNGGDIDIQVRVEGDRVLTEVRDTGRGMTEEIRKRVFDPFFTTKGVKGNGLGMSVAYGIITRHKGEISVESELGMGTSVRVVLPVDLSVTRESEVDEPISQRRTGRFLIIDDEAPIRDLLAELLAEQGHIVFTASGGKEGLDIFHNELPELVITDLGMPEVSGWDVASTVKSVRPETSVILMTGWGITLDHEKAHKRGVDVVISKPFQIGEMQKILNERLDLHYSAVGRDAS
ncbi:MAG: GAF domain-containing protein [Acidobacteriota bacterium]